MDNSDGLKQLSCYCVPDTDKDDALMIDNTKDGLSISFFDSYTPTGRFVDYLLGVVKGVVESENVDVGMLAKTQGITMASVNMIHEEIRRNSLTIPHTTPENMGGENRIFISLLSDEKLKGNPSSKRAVRKISNHIKNIINAHMSLYNTKEKNAYLSMSPD